MPGSDEDRRRLTGVVELEGALPDDRPGFLGRLRQLCSAVTRETPATWAGVSLIEGGIVRGTVGGSHRHALALEDLQFDLGEGPCLDSVREGRPVMESDLAGAGFGRWPAYAFAAHQLGVRAVSAFPLHVGAVCVGALGVYRDWPEPLSGEAVFAASTFADIAMQVLLSGQAKASSGQLTPELAEVLAPRRHVYEAQGMLMAVLDLAGPEAIARLRAHAFALGRPLAEVARDVVAGRLHLER